MRFQYSVVRYVPNPVRGEAVNVGVIVRDVARSAFASHVLSRSATVGKLWPTADRELVAHFRKQLKRLENPQLSLDEQERGLPGIGHPLEKGFFARARGEFNGNLQLTEVRGIAAENLEDALAWAFETFVAEPPGLLRPINYQVLAPYRVRSRLWTAFERRSLIRPGRVQERVRLRGRHAPWTFDLAYRNGIRKVVNSLAWSAGEQANLGRALVFKGMVEDVAAGRSQVVEATAVVQRSNDPAEAAGADQAERLLKDATIDVVAIADLATLVDRIESELLGGPVPPREARPS